MPEQTYEVTVSLSAVDTIESLENLMDVKSVEQVREGFEHSFDVGDYAIDSNEPTASPEANTVEIVETTGKRANEYVVEETDQTVAQHNTFWPGGDPVVIGRYPNMSGEKEFAFPESRLRKV